MADYTKHDDGIIDAMFEHYKQIYDTGELISWLFKEMSQNDFDALVNQFKIEHEYNEEPEEIDWKRQDDAMRYNDIQSDYKKPY